jgi:hypothetical protein
MIASVFSNKEKDFHFLQRCRSGRKRRTEKSTPAIAMNKTLPEVHPKWCTKICNNFSVNHPHKELLLALQTLNHLGRSKGKA